MLTPTSTWFRRGRAHADGDLIAVGKQPEKVLVAPDDTVYVTNRLDRSVSVIRK